jgi:hypothetical protein
MSVFTKTMIALTAINVGCIAHSAWSNRTVSDPTVKFRAMPELTAEEKRKSSLLVPIGETTLVLKFVPPSEWRHYDRLEEKLQKDYVMVGFARVWRDPCEIILPAGDHAIWAHPKSGQARFDGEQLAKTLAHEILHCLKGTWHPDWTEIFGSRK